MSATTKKVKIVDKYREILPNGDESEKVYDEEDIKRFRRIIYKENQHKFKSSFGSEENYRAYIKEQNKIAYRKRKEKEIADAINQYGSLEAYKAEIKAQRQQMRLLMILGNEALVQEYNSKLSILEKEYSRVMTYCDKWNEKAKNIKKEIDELKNSVKRPRASKKSTNEKVENKDQEREQEQEQDLEDMGFEDIDFTV